MNEYSCTTYNYKLLLKPQDQQWVQKPAVIPQNRSDDHVKSNVQKTWISLSRYKIIKEIKNTRAHQTKRTQIRSIWKQWHG